MAMDDPVIPQSAVEAAARSICIMEPLDPDEMIIWGGSREPRWQSFVSTAEAALRAALPHLTLDHTVAADVEQLAEALWMALPRGEVRLGHVKSAISALQPTITAPHQAGRREAFEKAADYLALTLTYTGRGNEEADLYAKGASYVRQQAIDTLRHLARAAALPASGQDFSSQRRNSYGQDNRSTDHSVANQGLRSDGRSDHGGISDVASDQQRGGIDGSAVRPRGSEAVEVAASEQSGAAEPAETTPAPDYTKPAPAYNPGSADYSSAQSKAADYSDGMPPLRGAL